MSSWPSIEPVVMNLFLFLDDPRDVFNLRMSCSSLMNSAALVYTHAEHLCELVSKANALGAPDGTLHWLMTNLPPGPPAAPLMRLLFDLRYYTIIQDLFSKFGPSVMEGTSFPIRSGFLTFAVGVGDVELVKSVPPAGHALFHIDHFQKVDLLRTCNDEIRDPE